MALLGLDLGGTKLVLVVGDGRGEPRSMRRMPTPLSGDAGRDVAAIAEAARALLAEAGVGTPGGEPLEGIGASVPGPTDPERGVLINPPNLPGWHDVPIGPLLEEALGAPVRVENDANAAGLAEATWGAGRGVADLVYLTMSTGVGGGVISGGRLIVGAFGGAGEPGHLPIETPGRPCACGLRGCLEAYVGGRAWQAWLRETLDPAGRSVALAGGARDAVRPEHLVAAAREGDPEARAEFGRWLDHLATGLVSIVMLLEPRRVVLGTIAVAAGEALCFAPLRERMARRLWAQQAERLEIVPAELGDALPQRAGLAVALHGVGSDAV